MKIVVNIKLLPDTSQHGILKETLERTNAACNYLSEVGWNAKVLRQYDLHKLAYKDTKNKFGIVSDMVVRCIAKVADAYKLDKKTKRVFRKHSAHPYNHHILNFSKKTDVVSISTTAGRLKIPFVMGEYQRKFFPFRKGESDLLFIRGKFYLACVCDIDEPELIESRGVLGVDLGIVNIATTSDGDFFSGKECDTVRIKMAKFKKILQAKGSRSAKRHLKKLSGHETRFKKNTNHVISKQIVSIAAGTNRAIGLEDLKGFKATVNRAQKERFGKWAFDELGRFIDYKAKQSGIPVFRIDPRNTSKGCSRCNHISKSNRKTQAVFLCQKCGFQIHADINGAINIATRATVNLPIAVRSHSLLSPPLGIASRLF
jgi:IS605 OrfB family transposase